MRRNKRSRSEGNRLKEALSVILSRLPGLAHWPMFRRRGRRRAAEELLFNTNTLNLKVTRLLWSNLPTPYFSLPTSPRHPLSHPSPSDLLCGS